MAKSGLSYGDGDELPLRTFHNHRKAIRDIFDIHINCDTKHGYRYCIDEPERLESDRLRNWLIDSYATLNQIQADKKLEGKIIFEDIPSGHLWLTAITDAMRRNKVLYITHQGFGKPEPNSFEIEPYYLKVVNRRWYVIARSPYYSERNKAKGNKPEVVYLVYALDRITQIEETDKSFHLNKDFDVDEYFVGCCGVITSDVAIERVVILAYNGFADYLRILPLHSSQKELESNDESTLFEYHVKPTFDFYQLLLAQGDQIEVIEPKSVRDMMRNFVINLMDYYGRG
ncbi:helix-turn-helix transcriptional regulator [Coprobacter secundus]|uniref:WYL domain-containing protein n=1 Tax=Coprobacter secundus subsp. similis TaxID=2751153 RepID=A0A7G1I5V1_9BACT|nr:WYL domain-containing protein [Coprobacter secundus subsp. similis]